MIKYSELDGITKENIDKGSISIVDFVFHLHKKQATLAHISGERKVICMNPNLLNNEERLILEYFNDYIYSYFEIYLPIYVDKVIEGYPVTRQTFIDTMPPEILMFLVCSEQSVDFIRNELKCIEMAGKLTDFFHIEKEIIH